MNLLDILLELLDNPNRHLTLKYDKDNRFIRVVLCENDNGRLIGAESSVCVKILQANPYDQTDMMNYEADRLNRRINLKKELCRETKKEEEKT